jgi:hypothetical protein
MELNTDSIVESTSLSHLETGTRRATELRDRVLETNPNHGRCTVENCDASRAIKYCHIVDGRGKKELRTSTSWFLEGMRLIIVISSIHSNGSGTGTVDMLIMHSSMHYEIANKTRLFFAESVQNPNMHYELFYAL